MTQTSEGCGDRIFHNGRWLFRARAWIWCKMSIAVAKVVARRFPVRATLPPGLEVPPMMVRFARPSKVFAFAMALLALAPHAYPVGKERVLHSFTGKGEGGALAAPTLGGPAHLYGTAGSVFEMTKGRRGWSEKTIFTFNVRDGNLPAAPLIIDQSGNLYGTTVGGGSQDQGVVFELTPNTDGWAESVLYNFCSQGGGYCTDGQHPFAGVVMDTADNLYGATRDAGPYNGGVVYELTPNSGSWTYSLIYGFCSKPNCEDGGGPYVTPVLDKSGNLYGMAIAGGPPQRCSRGCYIVYEVSPSAGGGWNERVLHRFTGANGPTLDGVGFDGAGNLYGTTTYGGKNGHGRVFKLSPSAKGSWKATVLYTFPHAKDGGWPQGTLAIDKHGTLYGIAGGGGGCGGTCGLIYKLAPQAHGKWKYSVVYKFNGSDGQWPQGGLVLDKEQKHLYGATEYGGAYGYGVVFEITL